MFSGGTSEKQTPSGMSCNPQKIISSGPDPACITSNLESITEEVIRLMMLVAVLMILTVLVMTFLWVLQLLWSYFVLICSTGKEQVERPWQARKVPDRIGERHKSGVQVDYPKERQVGMDPVQDDDYRCWSNITIDQWSWPKLIIDQRLTLMLINFEQCIIRWERTVSKTSTFQLFP